MSEILQSRSVDRTFAPEVCPYETVIIDVTHRCNMACANCYVPNRSIPDLDRDWLISIFARLPRGRFIRFVGGEPTLRDDLPLLIREARVHGHHPVVVSNGLRMASRDYVRSLKAAGLQIAYLSFNGGFDDELYWAIDEMRCAEKKRLAFENLRAEHVFTSVGMIIARGLNEGQVRPVLEAVRKSRNVREFHLRSIGAMGRYMDNPPLSLDELLDVFAFAADVDADSIDRRERTDTSHDFTFGRQRIQLTVWPDLGSVTRGRLTPAGDVAPFMEHVIANEGGY
jgi:MoaA/NifB/PqqE/SkfB family radical SAM enzyme